ncbi:MAG: hypothetical protein H7325_11270, partial [Pedobacter sp.]|nr:hypothetical protein [Pedobacter sp.]
NNNDLEDDRYKDALKKFENSEVINQMAYYKVQNFPEFNNFIVDFEIKDEILHVKSQSFEDYFMNVVSSMMDVRSE